MVEEIPVLSAQYLRRTVLPLRKKLGNDDNTRTHIKGGGMGKNRTTETRFAASILLNTKSNTTSASCKCVLTMTTGDK